ncbi:hypothetical protein [Burkholderia sp. 3C]
MGNNMTVIKPPIAFAVNATKFMSAFPTGSDQLWAADVKACRHAFQCDVFEDVLFVESNGTAFIFGVEFEDGYPRGLRADLAEKQQAFIRFLRAETQQDNEALGPISAVFSGHEYSSEGKATAAYIVARGERLTMGVGYRNDAGEYELIGIDPEEDSWLEGARRTLSFDELG